MKEHQDDVLLSVKKYSPSVDFTTAGESVTESGKIEGFLGEKHEREDMMVDVVGADVVDDHGGSGVQLEGKVGFNGSVEEGSERGTKTLDQVMEGVRVVEEVCDAAVGSKDLTSEKVEVAVSEEGVKRSVEVGKAIIGENVVTTVASVSDYDAQKSGNGTVVGDSKMASEPSKVVSKSGLTKEIVEQPTESVQEVADGDHVMDVKTGKEIAILNSSKISVSFTTTANLGSPKGHVVDGEECLVGKDKSEDGVKNQSLSTEVVDAGKGEDNVFVTTKNLDLPAGVDQMSTESSLPTTEVTGTYVQKSGNGTQVGDSNTAAESLSGEPQLVEGETVIQEEESERGLTKETLEGPIESVLEANVDCVMNEKTVKDEVLNSPKIVEPVNIGGVVVNEEFGGKDKAQDGVSKDPSSECPNNPSFSSYGINAGTDVGAVDENAGSLDQKAAVDQMSKEESSHSTIEVRKDDAQKSETGTGVGDSMMDCKDPQFIEGKDKAEEPEGGSAEEIVEQPLGSVQEVADGDCVMNEKNAKEDEPLTMTSLGSEEVDVVVVGGLEGKDEAQDDTSVEPSVVCPDNQSLSTEVGNAGTGEGAVHVNTDSSDQKAEVDPTSKDQSSHPTIEFMIADASHKSSKVSDLGSTQHFSVKNEVLTIGNKVHDSVKNMDVAEVEGSRIQAVVERFKTEGDEVAACSKVDEVTTAHKLPNSDVQAFTAGGIVLENHNLEVNVAACTEPESSIDKMEPATTDEVIEIDGGVQTSKVLGNTLHDSGKSIDVTEVEGSRFQAVDERSKTEGDEVAVCKVDEVTTALKIPNSEVQASTAGGIVLENQNSEVNVAARTEPESLIDKTVPATTDKVVETDGGVQTSNVEPQTIGETSNFEDQGLKGEAVNRSLISANPSNDQFLLNSGNEITVDVPCTGEMKGSENSVQPFDEAKDATAHADYAKRGVLPESSEFSYEETHMERGEDAGMDIDEVLGWKDEIPGIEDLSGEVVCREKDQDANTEADVEQQEEDLKSRQPIVYERRVHVEVPVEMQSGNSAEIKVETTNLVIVDEKVNEDVNGHSGTGEQTDFCRNQEMEALDDALEAERSTCTDDATETLDSETSVLLQQSCYFHSPENEGEFSVSDLVWGKVRSHPWWPGQIFDPSDASEKAMKYHKKDCFLVAYFGDRTFAWNDSSVLKPFRAKFSQIEKHSNSEAFNNAVRCALEEVSRRVELGLACSCVSQDIYEKINCQVVENAGIRQESSRRHGIDKSASVSSFEPDKLLDYVRLLAKFPYGEGDKVDLAMAKAQLSSYSRYKGYRQLPEFQFCGNLLEDSSMLSEEVQQVIKDGQQISEKKERSLSQLTVDATYSGDGAEGIDGNIIGDLVSSPGSKKRKALDSISDGSEKRPSLHSETGTPTAKPSFKVGECIQRVASQLTGPPSVPKSGSDKNMEPTDQPVGVVGSVQSPGHAQQGQLSNQAHLPDMLSQLHMAAQDPMKGYSFLDTIIPFFHSHRASVLSKSLRQNSSAGRLTDPRKRKTSNENDPEEYEFDDVNDSYWTDRVIQNYPEEQPLQDNQNGGGENPVVPYEQDKPVKPSRRSNKKRFFSSNHEIEAKEQSELMERRRQNLATEVLMKFTEGIYFPSEIHLNKMFRRFGPLMESETEVDRQSGRARVVFKKCSDAEVAHSSAGKFNIFGSIGVNYELNYTPLISYKPLLLPLAQDPADAC